MLDFPAPGGGRNGIAPWSNRVASLKFVDSACSLAFQRFKLRASGWASGKVSGMRRS